MGRKCIGPWYWEKRGAYYGTVGGERKMLARGVKGVPEVLAKAWGEYRLRTGQLPADVLAIADELVRRPEMVAVVRHVLAGGSIRIEPPASSNNDTVVPLSPDVTEAQSDPNPFQLPTPAVDPPEHGTGFEHALAANIAKIVRLFDLVDWQKLLTDAKTGQVNRFIGKHSIDTAVLHDPLGALASHCPNPAVEFDPVKFRNHYLKYMDGETTNVKRRWKILSDVLGRRLGIRHQNEDPNSFVLAMKHLKNLYPKEELVEAGGGELAGVGPEPDVNFVNSEKIPDSGE